MLQRRLFSTGMKVELFVDIVGTLLLFEALESSMRKRLITTPEYIYKYFLSCRVALWHINLRKSWPKPFRQLQKLA